MQRVIVFAVPEGGTKTAEANRGCGVSSDPNYRWITVCRSGGPAALGARSRCCGARVSHILATTLRDLVGAFGPGMLS